MTKRCSQCGETKSLEDFNRQSHRPDGRRSECAACTRASDRRYRLAHPDRRQASRRRWREKNQQHVLDYAKAWAAQNPERKKQKDREWFQSNPERKRAYDHQRRERLGKPLGGESVEYIGILRIDPCSYCGKSAGHVDHIEAIVSGGANDWLNFTASCKSCNSSKHATPLLLFLAGTRDARGGALKGMREEANLHQGGFTGRRG